MFFRVTIVGLEPVSCTAVEAVELILLRMRCCSANERRKATACYHCTIDRWYVQIASCLCPACCCLSFVSCVLCPVSYVWSLISPRTFRRTHNPSLLSQLRRLNVVPLCSVRADGCTYHIRLLLSSSFAKRRRRSIAHPDFSPLHYTSANYSLFSSPFSCSFLPSSSIFPVSCSQLWHVNDYKVCRCLESGAPCGCKVSSSNCPLLLSAHTIHSSNSPFPSGVWTRWRMNFFRR